MKGTELLGKIQKKPEELSNRIFEKHTFKQN